MKLIVGLGNPGSNYSKNRHNLGFILVDQIAKDWEVQWHLEDRFSCEMVKHKLASGEFIILAKPTTFMNDSGKAVSAIRNYFKIDDSDIFVVHDELDLPFSVQKKQTGSGSAGHNGVQSIIDSLGTNDFWRLRVGIGRPDNPNISPTDWVLMDFTSKELSDLSKMHVLPILIG